MTGYGMAEKHTTDYSVKVELRSLNGKYLDLNLRVPRFLMSKEIEIRNTFGKQIERGSATLSINVVKHKVSENDIQVNDALASQIYKKLTGLSEKLNAPQHDIFRITTMMQDVVYQDEEQLDAELYTLVKEVGELAYADFDAFRLREGEELRAVLKSYAQNIAAGIPKIEVLEPIRTESTKERLQKNLKQLVDDESFDKNRFEQELIYYLEKYDINEEKHRLQAHCDHFCEALNNNPKGKSLNFIAQEMGREINTLGSKANHAGIQKEVVAMKEELEKIKEQALNLL
ncbi:MAG: hypothetical protein ACI8S2_001590 [Bacteroidia bacterium]|jgi:uncharacterized protein (TIGR00255 family)